MTVLVTGGAGFIGAHLVRALVGRGEAVRVLDNLVTGTPENLARALDLAPSAVRRALADADGRPVRLSPACEVIVGDIRDPATLDRACAGVEVVFHQAALRSVPRSMEHPVETHEVNATGTVRLLEAARRAGVRRVVYASSSSVYGDTPLPKHEGQQPQPKSPYAASKLATEVYSQAYTRAFGLSTVGLRYFNVFGPWQDPASEYAAVIPKFIRLALEGRPLPVHGDGLQSRDFTYIDDVVEANLQAAAAGAEADGAVVNIGAGARHTLLDLVAEIAQVLGQAPQVVHEPPRPGDVRHTEADITLARRLLGYAPRIGFREGLRRTVEAMREEVSTGRVSPVAPAAGAGGPPSGGAAIRRPQAPGAPGGQEDRAR
ncbi:MAG: NAD-dependent epimerase/dehydratase family protein [Armatimonadota bacterium]|nr:NAD-dependent epimerase/dehydratase family protein [Armatimonadota bacterium]